MDKDIKNIINYDDIKYKVGTVSRTELDKFLSIFKKYLNERIYRCKACHNELDRDINASINIMFVC